jgi:hypothetical protein
MASRRRRRGRRAIQRQKPLPLITSPVALKNGDQRSRGTRELQQAKSGLIDEKIPNVPA